MKKYRLKQWYPGLPEEWNDRKVVAEIDGNEFYFPYVDGYEGLDYFKIIEQAQNSPHFWEKLPGTDDNKPIFSKNDIRRIIAKNKFRNHAESDNYLLHYDDIKRELQL